MTDKEFWTQMYRHHKAIADTIKQHHIKPSRRRRMPPPAYETREVNPDKAEGWFEANGVTVARRIENK